MADITAAAGGGNWTAGATWTGGVAPTAADNAILAVTSGGVTINSGAVARSLDCTGYTGTLTHTAAVTLTIGDGTAGAGNVALKLVAGMTYTLGSVTTSAITFISTSATQQTITTGGKTLGNWTVNGVGSSYLLSDANTVGAGTTVTLTNGTLNTGGQTCSWGIFASSNSNTRALTLGASSITMTGSGGNNWSIATTTGMTLSAASSTITWSAAGPEILLGAGLTYGNIVISSSGSPTLQSAATMANLTRTGSTVKTGQLNFGANQTVTGTLTITGNSAINRLLITSTTLGMARTITAAAVSINNVDFTDITGAGAAAPFTGTSLGNALGNSGITFDTPVTQTHTASAGGNWSDATKWTSRVPLPQDDVVVDVNTTGTLTADMPRLGANLTFTGFTGTLSVSIIIVTQYGDLTYASGMTVSATGASNIIETRSRSAATFTTQGLSYSGSYAFTNFGAVLTVVGDLIGTGTNVAISRGTTTFQNNVTCKVLSHVTALASTVLNMGSGTFTLTGTSGTVWNMVAGGVLNAGTSTIVISGASVSTRTFIGGGKTYNILTYTVAGSTGGLDITGSNTFNTINFSDTTNVRSLLFTAATTTTVTNWNVNGTPGLLMTIDTVTAATHTLTKPNGTVSSDYLSITNSIATGGAGWYAGANSTNVSGNTGWLFQRPVFPARTITNFRLTV